MLTDRNIYEKNFQALQIRYPELAERVKHTRIVNYELFQSPGCAPNVKHLILNEPWYRGVMTEYFEAQWKGLKLENVRMPIFLGFGLGYEVQYFFHKYAAEFNTQGAIIIERDIELFVAAMNASDISEMVLSPALHFIVGIPEEDLYLVYRDFFMNNLKDMLFTSSCQPLVTEIPLKISKAYYMNACGKFFEASWDNLHNFGNCPEDSLIGVENMFDNVLEIANNPGINLLYDKFKGKPAIIVATGPSLKKNIHLLKGLEDKALILSVDASLKLLLANGIKPHMVTSLEREHAVQQFFDEIPEEECKDVYMAACPVLFNHVYQSYNGPKIIVYRNFDHFKWLGIDRGILDIRLSSSNMAFTIAKALGCDPIIMVGQDLAYGEDGETHATPVPFSSAGENELEVKGNLTDLVKTNDGWVSFLKAHEVDIAHYSGTVYNCTEGGAYISGTRVEPLQKIIDLAVTEVFNPLDIIKEELKNFTSAEDDIEKLKILMDNTIRDVKDIIDLCIEGSKLDEDLPIAELMAPRAKIIDNYNHTFQLLLMHIVQSIHLSLEMQYVMKIYKMSKWYSYVGDITNICLQSLLKAKDDLNVR